MPTHRLQLATVRSTLQLQTLGVRQAVNARALGLVAGNVIYAASQWALVVTVAKVGSVVQVGEFAYALALTAPVFILSQLQLRGLQATDAGEEYSFAEYASLRAVMTGAALLAVGGMVAMVADVDRGVILAMAVAKAVESLADVAHGRLQQRDRVSVVSASFASRGIGGWLAFAAAFVWSHELVPAIAAMTLWWAGSYAVLEGRAIWRDGGLVEPARPAHLVRLALFATPMGIVMTLSSLNIQVPRYFVDASLGTGALGIFAGLAAIPAVGTTIMVPLCQAAATEMARASFAGRHDVFRRTFLHLLWIATGLGVLAIGGAALLGDRLLTLVYSAEYATDPRAFLVLACWGAISYVAVVLGSAATAARRIGVQMPVLALNTLVTLVAAMVLVPRMGIAGAGLAAALGALAQTLAFAVVLLPLLRRRPA